MPRTPLKQIGCDYAENIMAHYTPTACECEISEIHGWLENKSKECLGIPIHSAIYNLSPWQKRRISQYAKKHASKLQQEKLNAYPTWYPCRYEVNNSSEYGYDPWDY